jgi:heavy metal efflux system protein
VIERLARASVAQPRLVLGVTTLLAVAALFVLPHLRLDALPDITGNQVLVLTSAPGFTPEEVERLVTRPVEMALGGLPGAESQRSISRYGISSVTVLFGESVNPYLARQIVQERLNGVAGSLPLTVNRPELGPLTGGLGEIYQFTLSSERRTTSELLELAQYEVSPLLRTVPGVVEVNTWGGSRRTLDVVADPVRMAGYALTLADLQTALATATGGVPGASVDAGSGQVLLRGVARPVGVHDLGAATLLRTGAGLPLRVSDVATVVPGALPRTGAATADGGGETVYLMSQMLRGANALEVIAGIHKQIAAAKEVLPPDVKLTLVYDRSLLVRRTLRTVFANLAEGGVLVIAVLFALLGSLRAGLVVALTIPLSMLGAVAGMAFMGIPGNLMSLGAIDFGLLVDGAVVMVENTFHELAPGHAGSGAARPTDMAAVVRRVVDQSARPVFFGVLIILLVYVPILSLTGVDGRLFRPMALSVIFALFTALVLSLTYVPAATRLFVRPSDVPLTAPLLIRVAQRLYSPALMASVARPRAVLVGALALLAVGGVLLWRSGSEFVPQLDEGDLVIQTTRPSNVSLATATDEANRLEAALLAGFPEVVHVVSRIGSPAVATDIMGIEQADVFVSLKPRDEWRAGVTRDGLIAAMHERLSALSPNTTFAFTQPIQMRFNELIGGETSDVSASLFGPDLVELRRLAVELQTLVAATAGAEDVRIMMPPAVPVIEVRPRPGDAAQQGFTTGDILAAVQAVRTGVVVGETFDGVVRVPIRLILGGAPGVESLKQAALPNHEGRLVPLRSIADLDEGETPSLVNHQLGQRRVVVGFNVRGRELGDVVVEAQGKARASLVLPTGYRIGWGGQYESLAEAKARMNVVVPVVVVGILLVLLWLFRAVRPALLILLNVPFAAVGGLVALALRGMPLSLSAIIGFIALSGVAVLNGVVFMSRLLVLEHDGHAPGEAARLAALERMRPVLMTALVAALGFVPMMLATGVGAEIQRPLATVVVGGLVTSTVLTLLILPAVYGLVAKGRTRAIV